MDKISSHSTHSTSEEALKALDSYDKILKEFKHLMTMLKEIKMDEKRLKTMLGLLELFDLLMELVVINLTGQAHQTDTSMKKVHQVKEIMDSMPPEIGQKLNFKQIDQELTSFTAGDTGGLEEIVSGLLDQISDVKAEFFGGS